MKRRLSVVVGLTLLSQILSAGATLLLPLLGPQTADTYAIASQVGLTGFTGVVVGVVYNLAIGRPQFKRWKASAAIAASVSVGFAFLQLLILWQSGFFDRGDRSLTIWAILLFGLGGALISQAGVVGVRLACLGRPAFFAGITVLPNAGFAAGVLVGATTDAELAPALGWVVASISLVVIASILNRREARTVAELEANSTLAGLQVHAAALALGVVTSTALPLFYIAAIGQLNPGTVYIVALTARIANSAVSLFVNSVMLVKYNWIDARLYSATLPLALSISFIAAVLISTGLKLAGVSTLVSDSLTVMGWVAILIAAALTNREVNARRHGKELLAKVLVELLLAPAAAWLLFTAPTIGGYFGAFAVSQGITIAMGGWALKQRSLILAGGAAVFAAFASIIL